jgi:hypothetical protein
VTCVRHTKYRRTTSALGFVWIESEIVEWTVIQLLPSLHEIVTGFSPQAARLVPCHTNVFRAFLSFVARGHRERFDAPDFKRITAASIPGKIQLGESFDFEDSVKGSSLRPCSDRRVRVCQTAGTRDFR